MVKKKDIVDRSMPCSRCFASLLIISVVLFVLHAIFIFTNFLHGNDYVHDVSANIFIVLLSTIALISSILIYRKVSDNFPREKRAKFFLIISLFLFLLGDILWLAMEVFFGDLTPIGSYPDYIWLLAYVFLVISLVYFILISFRPSKMTTVWIIILGLIVGGAILYFDVAEDLEEGSFTYAHAIQDVYILFDYVVLFLVIYLIWPIIPAGRKYYLNWVVLGVGIITRAVYDQLFANMSQAGTYYSGHPVDLLYVFFYVCVVISFYFKSKLLECVQ